MLQPFSSELIALAEVLLIDVVLAGDNAIVVGMAAAGVRADIRRKVIVWGIAGAVVLRVLLALVTTQLLQVIGLTLAGGLLLLWVCWKMFRELRSGSGHAATDAENGAETDRPRKTFGQAIWQVMAADVSMSLDNVLAVAGAAREHPVILTIGLVLSVGLMGAAATLIAKTLAQFPWLAWIGLLIILYVAGDMIWDGLGEVRRAAD